MKGTIMCKCSNECEEARKFQKVCQVIEEYNHDKSKLIPILQKTQAQYRYLPEEILMYIATSLDIAPATVYGVATFYSHFNLKPKGKHIIHVCDGTACHVKGSIKILEALQKKLGLTDEDRTTKDMLFTIETVSCLGACGLAPVITINDKVHGQITPEQAVKLLEELQTEEKE
jgi:NADH-quinone oxidoreductase subunit E